jgi:translation initiation factor 1
MDKLVYSSGGKEVEKKDSKKVSAYEPANGPCKMRLEKKGRGGKCVTVLFNLPFTEEGARNMMKAIQNKLGCGATFKNGTIEIQGDVRAKVKDFFVAQGEKIIGGF